MDDINNIKKAIVIGAGVSGINAANLLSAHVGNVCLYEENPDVNVDKIRENLADERIKIIIGELTEEELESAVLVVPSPGVFPESEIFRRVAAKGKIIWGEIELAYRFEKGEVIAITGTNGKTTTTTLIGEVIKAWNANTFVVGNIGIPYTSEVEKTTEDSVSVAEISSYQLETMITFHPKIAAILNITPDHLDRHHTMDEYAGVKESICKNQTKDDICVLNYDDERLRDFGERRCPATVVWYGRTRRPDRGYYFEDDIIYKVDGDEKIQLININDTNLLGTHNYENMMAAYAVGEASGVPVETITRVVKNFKAVEHRIEFVSTVNGVDYYNDSKGTNPDASIKAIEAMRKPTILIGGGYDKSSSFEEYIAAFGDKVKELVVLGTTADKIAETAQKAGFENVIKVRDMEEAVKVCKRDAQNGDCVLLSPACASWDMFPNYEVRGRKFKEYVNS